MPEPDKHILLAKWLEGSLTDEEAKALEDMEQLGGLKVSLQKLERYDFPPMDEAALLKKIVQKRSSKKAKTRRFIPIWARAAAAIALLIVLSLWWQTTRGTSIIAGIGEHKEFILPEQSKVSLNAASSLRYFEKNWKTERYMKLEGEAFFKVTKGVPFRVETAEGLVEVLGTQFKVYDRGNIFEVVCYEGKVRVISEKAALQSVLQKGEGLKVAGNVFTKFKEEKLKPDWTNGISVFSKASLSRVFAEMERQYNIHFVFSNTALQRSFSGEFPHNDLEGALERVCGAMSLSYTINADAKTVEIRAIE